MKMDLSKVKDLAVNKDIDYIERKLQDVQIDEPESFVCIDCGGGFKNKGYLEHHREKKHGEVLKPFMCEECEKILQSKRNLEDHIVKIHRTCKLCKLKFGDKDALSEHKKTHTTCQVCSVDMKTKYKLDRHLKTHM